MDQNKYSITFPMRQYKNWTKHEIVYLGMKYRNKLKIEKKLQTKMSDKHW